MEPSGQCLSDRCQCGVGTPLMREVRMSMVRPTLPGIEMLSSNRRRGEIFSTRAPTSPATTPMTTNEMGAEIMEAMTRTTPMADPAKARVPSKLLSKKRWDP